MVCESPLLTGRVIARLADDVSARKSSLSALISGQATSMAPLKKCLEKSSNVVGSEKPLGKNGIFLSSRNTWQNPVFRWVWMVGNSQVFGCADRDCLK